MKTKAFTLFAGLALVMTARAGTEAAPAPAPESSLWQWFVGGSGGYVTDFDAGMYNLQAGMEYRNPADKGSHAFYLEVGFTQDDANYRYNPGIPGGIQEQASIDMNLVPITFNYKYEAPIAEHFKWYAGLGLGIAILDTSYDWKWTQAVPPPNRHREGSEDQTNVRFYGDVFAGLAYEVNPSFEIFLGGRYIFMDEVDHHINVKGAGDYEEGINGDALIELGARFYF